MTYSGYTSVYEIIERVFEMFDNEDVPMSTIIRHISDALLLIGSFKYFEDKTDVITIENNKGALPCDLIYINQTREYDKKIPMSYASYSFQTAIHAENSPDLEHKGDYTYSVNGSNIFTSFETGEVEMNYRAMPVDDDGYPLIPDDIKFKLAVEYYIMGKIAEKLFLLNKVTGDKFQWIQQQKDWYVGAAQSRGNIPSHEEMETISNQMTRIIEQPLAHSRFYKDTHKPETFRKHPSR